MASHIIGVEFGSSTLKLALLSGGTVKKAAVSRMPKDLVRSGQITAPGVMAEFLKTSLKAAGIRPGACALVLPSQQVIPLHLSMPAMSEKELMLNLPYEFRDLVGKEGGRYDYDYSVIRVRDGIMELYAAAVPLDVVEEYCRIFRKAGLTVKAAMPPEIAWQNLLRCCPDLPEKLCLVDIGHSQTRVSFFEHGVFLMGKTIDMAGLHIDRAIAADLRTDLPSANARKEADADHILSARCCQEAYRNLTDEIVKAIRFFSYTHTGGAPLADLYCCGGSSAIEPLRKALSAGTGLRVHQIYPVVDYAHAHQTSPAIGAVLQLQKGVRL